ncbi:MAG: interleukin-like EMT inducer domain-containing protein [Caldilineales bacterium]
MLAAFLVFENLSAPLPMADMQTPSIYAAIAAEPGDFAVLDLPVGWRNGFSVFGKQDLIIMSEQWWQTSHGKPILGGNTSRNPEFKFRYFLEAPLIGPLTVLANADDGHPHIQAQMADALAALRAGDRTLADDPLLNQAAADAAQALQALNIRFVVVHRDQVPPEFVTFVEQYLPVTLVAQDGVHVLYRVQATPPADDLTIRPATDPLARGEGWSGLGSNQRDATSLWAQRRETALFAEPVAPGPYTTAVRAAAAGPGQTLSLVVNGFQTAEQSLPTEWSDLSFRLPTEALSELENRIELRFGHTYPVDTLTGSNAQLSLLVESAGLEAGNYAHIWLNGRDVSPNKRGYNLAIIDGATGKIKAVDSFDTHGDPAASPALIAFVQQAGPGDLLAVAVKDTASDQLSAEAAQALIDLGLSDLQGRFRWAQTGLVTIDDSGKLAAVEEVDGLQAASVGTGAGWRESNVAAQVVWLKVVPAAN